MVVLAGMVWWLWPGSPSPPPSDVSMSTDSHASDELAPSESVPRARPHGGTQASAADGASHAGEPAAPAGIVSGVVRAVAEQSSGGLQPRAGVHVRLVRSPAAGPLLDDTDMGLEMEIPRADAETVTRADGAFAFDVAPTESWWLTVTRDRYQPQTFFGEGPSDLGDIELEGGELQRVLVLGADGSARPDGIALAYSESDNRYPVVCVKADGRGFVELPKLGGGAWFSAPGHAWTTARRSAEEVRLVRGFDTGGRVVDDEGVPLSGVQVTLHEHRIQRTVHTGADGRFHFERVAAVEHVDAVFAYERVKVSRPIPPGVSAAGLRVEIEWAEGADSRACITDPEGRFSAEVPGDAATVISVNRDGRLFGIVRADLSKKADVVLRAEPVGRIRVHIPPAWGRRCDLWLGAADGTLRWETETDELDDRSVLLLHDAPSGRVAVHAIVDGNETTLFADVRPGSETTVDFR
jgi:hypothetical protein